MPPGLNKCTALNIPEGLLLVVAAHPDDETLGLASFLPKWSSRVLIVHLTDGAPRNEQDAHTAGFNTAAEYAEARRKEVVNTLALAGIDEQKIQSFGFPDGALI